MNLPPSIEKRVEDLHLAFDGGTIDSGLELRRHLLALLHEACRLQRLADTEYNARRGWRPDVEAPLVVSGTK